MTTIDRKTTLPPCPDWCQNDSQGHKEDFDGEDQDGLLFRDHEIEYGDFFAGSDRARPGKDDLPGVFICTSQRDKMYGDRVVRGELRIALAADDFPHFTIDEIDALIATLTDVRDRAREIASGAA